MKIPATAVVAAFWVVSAASSASAQEPRVRLGAAGVISAQPEGSRSGPHLTSAIGGTAPGALVFVDALPTSWLSVGGELSWALSISGEQGTLCANFVSHHHDTVFSGTAKFGTGRGDGVRAAAVAGYGLARRQTHREGHIRYEIEPYAGPAYEETLTSWVPAVTGCVDVLKSGCEVCRT